MLIKGEIKLDKQSIIRFSLAVLGLLQLLLSQFFGIQISDETIQATVDVISAIVVTWAMWKNNYLTSKGKKQKQELKKKGLD